MRREKRAQNKHENISGGIVAPASVYIWLCVDVGWQEKPKIVPTRLTASKRTGKRYGTAVCALSNKATRQKEGIKKPITHRALN